MTRFSSLLPLALLASGSLLLASCGGGGSEDSSFGDDGMKVVDGGLTQEQEKQKIDRLEFSAKSFTGGLLSNPTAAAISEAREKVDEFEDAIEKATLISASDREEYERLVSRYRTRISEAIQLISTTTPPETPSETGSTTTPSSTEITAIYNGIKSDFTTDDSKINAAGRLDVFTSPPLPLGLDKTKLLSSTTTPTISSGWKRFTGSATVTGEERKAKVYTYATSKGQKISGSATGTFNNQKVVPSDGLTATDIRIPSFTKTTSTELTLTNQYSSIDGVVKSYSVSGTYDGVSGKYICTVASDTGDTCSYTNGGSTGITLDGTNAT